jgi:uncharacterized protein YbdZ (MbtH family)
MAGEDSFYFPGLNAKATNFDLIVEPAEKLDAAVGPPDRDERMGSRGGRGCIHGGTRSIGALGIQSIGPADQEIPAGWREASKKAGKLECPAYIDEVWIDMRPLSLLPAMLQR